MEKGDSFNGIDLYQAGIPIGEGYPFSLSIFTNPATPPLAGGKGTFLGAESAG
jgi:hypothetical protein